MESSAWLEHQKSAKTIPLILVSMMYMIPALSHGSLSAYVTLSLPQFLHPGNSIGFHLSAEESSWFAAIYHPFFGMGSISGSLLYKSIGAKRCLLISDLILITGYIIKFFAKGYYTLVTGAIISATGGGMTMNLIYTILSDISTVRLRGSLSTLNSFMANAGVVVGLLLGLVVPLRYLPLVKALPAIVFLIPFWKLPQSPPQLVNKGLVNDATSTLQMLRGKNYNVEPELKELEAINSSLIETKQVFPGKDKRFLKPALLIFILFCFQGSTGLDVIGTYAIIIFEHFNLEETVAAIIFYSLVSFGYGANTFIMPKVRRRIQYIAGSLMFAVGMALLGLAQFIPQAPYLPFISVVLCGLAYGGGIGPVPYTLMSELFPQKYKRYGPGLATATRACVVFLQLKMFNVLVRNIGMSGVFFVHTGILLLGCLYVLLVLPETKDKTQTELECLFYGPEDGDSTQTAEAASDLKPSKSDQKISQTVKSCDEK